MSAATVTPPSKLKRFFWGFTGRCAVCGEFRITTPWKLDGPRCSRCDFAIERKEGHFIGAVGINTIVTFGAMLIVMVISAAATSPDIPVGKLLIGNGIFVIVLSAVFFPISKTLWSAIDLMMIDLEPGEVDPRFDGLHDLEP